MALFVEIAVLHKSGSYRRYTGHARDLAWRLDPALMTLAV